MVITGQYHIGNNMSSKSRAAGEIFFESEKRDEIRPLKTDMLTVMYKSLRASKSNYVKRLCLVVPLVSRP